MCIRDSAIALQYRDGNLEKSISRKGIDVTNKISQIQDIPLKLPVSGKVSKKLTFFCYNIEVKNLNIFHRERWSSGLRL